MKVGSAFLIPSGTAHNPNVKHMFVVCTAVNPDGQVVLASISSWKNSLCDPTCILEAGAHPFVTKKSYVLYRKSRIESVETLQRGIDQSVFVVLDDVGPELVEIITAGIIKSKQTPWQVKRFVKKLEK